MPLLALGIAAVDLADGPVARATVFLYQTDPTLAGGVSVPPSYGDLINSASCIESNNQTWLYAAGQSFTPHIDYSYAVSSMPGNGGSILTNHFDAFSNSGDLRTAAFTPCLAFRRDRSGSGFISCAGRKRQ